MAEVGGDGGINLGPILESPGRGCDEASHWRLVTIADGRDPGGGARISAMTPEKWKALMDDARLVEKPFLYIHSACVRHPRWVYCFFLVFCIYVFAYFYSREMFESSAEAISALIVIVGIGPVFYFFSLRTMVWLLLRISGFKAEDLRSS